MAKTVQAAGREANKGLRAALRGIWVPSASRGQAYIAAAIIVSAYVIAGVIEPMTLEVARYHDALTHKVELQSVELEVSVSRVRIYSWKEVGVSVSNAGVEFSIPVQGTKLFINWSEKSTQKGGMLTFPLDPTLELQTISIAKAVFAAQPRAVIDFAMWQVREDGARIDLANPRVVTLR